MAATITHCAHWQLAGLCLLIAGSLLFHSEARPVAAADKPDADADKQLQADVDRLMELKRAGKDTSAYDQKVAAERFEAWRQAAERGSPVGQFLLARVLRVGTFVPKDEKAAFQWYRKSAEQGYAPAQASLGVSYIMGVGVDKDEKAGIDWLRKGKFHSSKQPWCLLPTWHRSRERPKGGSRMAAQSRRPGRCNGSGQSRLLSP
jgi:hypothetical protein